MLIHLSLVILVLKLYKLRSGRLFFGLLFNLRVWFIVRRFLLLCRCFKVGLCIWIIVSWTTFQVFATDINVDLSWILLYMFTWYWCWDYVELILGSFVQWIFIFLFSNMISLRWQCLIVLILLVKGFFLLNLLFYIHEFIHYLRRFLIYQLFIGNNLSLFFLVVIFRILRTKFMFYDRRLLYFSTHLCSVILLNLSELMFNMLWM